MNRIALTELWIILIVYPLFLAIPTLLQIYLSKRENKYLGWILPIVFFLGGTIYFLNLAPIEQEGLLSIIIPLIIFYFPTVLMIAIYKIVRKNYKNKSEIEKMNIKDL